MNKAEKFKLFQIQIQTVFTPEWIICAINDVLNIVQNKNKNLCYIYYPFIALTTTNYSHQPTDGKENKSVRVYVSYMLSILGFALLPVTSWMNL